MPRYFFNVKDGRDMVDESGTKLPDIYAAKNEAVRFSGELLRDMGAEFWNKVEWVLKVDDEQGRTLFVLRFSAEESDSISATEAKARGSH